MSGERLKGEKSIGENKRDAWLLEQEVKKFDAEWQDNLTKMAVEWGSLGSQAEVHCSVFPCTWEHLHLRTIQTE